MSINKNIVLLTGPPGAGKGTQSSIVADNFGWHVFSVGQLLRDTAPPRIKAMVDSGILLPKEEVVNLVLDEIKKEDGPVLVDGFPRRLDQIEAFAEMAQERQIGNYSVVLLFVNEDESWGRVSGRGRVDDERSAWEHRWKEYYQHTRPAVDKCDDMGILSKVDGSGNVEDVADRMQEALGL